MKDCEQPADWKSGAETEKLSMKSETTQSVSSHIRKHLELAGVAGLPRQWFAAPPSAEAETQPAPEKAESAPAGLFLPPEIAEADLGSLRRLAEGCTKCRLCEGRNKVVFGVGAEQPDLVFVGEGPGADEDRTGEPFVGKAGELLTAAITKGMGLRREDIYICNVVKCRPPANRAPLPDETQACTPYLYRQLELLSPRVIVTLGQPAQMALSGVNAGISKVRGNWQEWRGIRLMPTFHPAYILRNPSAKRLFWEDLQAVMEELGLKRG
jgi:DNA polymerase